ncbi:MAG: chemotaxis protein CheD [Proteobacteria bacterium]|nr:chemotaxis protein CheD [Pseudomonadota bacterium]MBU1715257.1 chemotaxis protein CheD [Pseudomonadota bacterium]
MSRLNPLHTDLPVVMLRPGELHVADKPTLISTILGSCVAVCLYSPRKKVGAMCHGVMPNSDQKEECARFVDCSINQMVSELVSRYGVVCSELEAKVFGGATGFDRRNQPGRQLVSIGRQNIESARRCLNEYGVPVLVEKVGGEKGCKMFFYSHTGEVLMKYLSRQNIVEENGQ